VSTPGLWACGSLGKVHGLQGELYLNLYPGGLEYLHRGTRFWVAGVSDDDAEAPPSPRECLILRLGGTDRRPLVRLDLAESREQAIALQGRELLASGEELDAIPHYSYADLIGLRASSGRSATSCRRPRTKCSRSRRPVRLQSSFLWSTS
jgi:ribosomal 30S subunit maturation factor RimM